MLRCSALKTTHKTHKMSDDLLTIAGKTYNSRLLVGSGKYVDLTERTNIGQNPNEENLLDAVPPEKYTILPNTAGCYTAEDAVHVSFWMDIIW